MKLYRLKPAVKDYLWGGTKLKRFWNKETAAETAAETWELSFHPDGRCRIAEAAGADCAGRFLDEEVKRDEYGTNCDKFPFFPVLVKLIDARENLSVQVHPGDEYALGNEGQLGKTEMWYIADCEPGAGIYCGFREEISAGEFLERIADNTLLEALRFFEVRPGESYFIPAGTVHAIGRGTTVCEIQQNSNLTYRVYDYGRLDRDGKPRALHVDRAARVADLTPYRPLPARELGEGVRLLASCPYFRTEERRFAGKGEILCSPGSYLGMTVVEGEGTLRIPEGRLSYHRGDTFFAPAQEGKIGLDGRGILLVTRTE